jgi:hypothetical protein
MKSVSFAEQAERILETAESGPDCTPMTILLGRDGIRLIADSDWPLDSLLWHHGADSAFRVQPHQGRIRVEGREGSRRCLLESNSPIQTARLLLNRSI